MPQFDVGLWLVTRASAGGAVVSLGGWLMLSYIPYLRYFLSILVGAAVGEVMSRLAKRRSAMLLDAAVVIAVIGGLLIVEMARTQQGLALFSLIANDPGVLMGIAIPAAIASFVAVVKMR